MPDLAPPLSTTGGSSGGDIPTHNQPVVLDTPPTDLLAVAKQADEILGQIAETEANLRNLEKQYKRIIETVLPDIMEAKQQVQATVTDGKRCFKLTTKKQVVGSYPSTTYINRSDPSDQAKLAEKQAAIEALLISINRSEVVKTTLSFEISSDIDKDEIAQKMTDFLQKNNINSYPAINRAAHASALKAALTRGFADNDITPDDIATANLFVRRFVEIKTTETP